MKLPRRPAPAGGGSGAGAGRSGSRAGQLRPLLAPIYVPTLVYELGASILVPVQVVLALRLGFSSAGWAAVLTALGALAVLASVVAGYLVERLGEDRAVAWVTAVGVAGLLAAAVAAHARIPGARWILVLGLVLADFVDGVWSIARQGLVAERAPAAVSGLAMNLYGACQRLGRVGGPALAALALRFLPADLVLPVAPAVMAIAIALFLRADGGSAAPRPVRPERGRGEGRLDRAALRRLLILGAGIVVLSALRTGKDSLLPLWAAQGVGLGDDGVAAVVALCSAMELVLFWPAGLALDRIGRAPVVVAAMAGVSLGMLVAPLSHSTAWLIVSASLIGLGNGVGAGIIKTIGADIAPPEARSRFLGWWQSINNIGDLVAPALASLLIAVASLGAALAALGALGMAGAVWMAHWTPRLVPHRAIPAQEEASDE